jgi:uncharacterized protein (DUF1330 family)
MPAYVIVDIHITDPAVYADYRELAPAAVAQYGGRYLARGGSVETLEGDWQPGRLVILEFPTTDAAKSWLVSPEYAPAKALRHQAARSNMIVIEGVAREELVIANHLITGGSFYE